MDVLAPEASSISVPVMGAGATLVADATGVVIVGLVDLAADAMAGAVEDAEAGTTGRQIMLCPSSW